MPPVVGEPPRASSDVSDETIEAQVRRLLSATFQPSETPQRRVDQRFPYARLVLLRPLDNEPSFSDHKPVVAVGKHLSEHGMGFFHPFPIPYRRVVAEVDLPDGGKCELLIELKWCRFTQFGWYESGGRFISPGGFSPPHTTSTCRPPSRL